MIVTVASFKGGVGKTTTAVHLAAYFQKKAPALLIDGDANRSASGWAKRAATRAEEGNPVTGVVHGRLPFRVVDERQAARFARDYKHIVIDTEAHPEEEDLRALADGCNLLVIPSTPDALALEALMLTVNALQRLGSERYRILLTIVPPSPSRDGEEARAMLAEQRLPVFKAQIARLVAFQKAALAGVPVYDVTDPRAERGWEDYVAIGKEILA